MERIIIERRKKALFDGDSERKKKRGKRKKKLGDFFFPWLCDCRGEEESQLES